MEGEYNGTSVAPGAGWTETTCGADCALEGIDNHAKLMVSKILSVANKFKCRLISGLLRLLNLSVKSQMLISETK